MRSRWDKKRNILKELLSAVTSTAALCTLFLLVSVLSLSAGQPKYLKADLRAGQAVEVKGHWEKTNVFIAEDLLVLPKPRRPKLRGEIQNIDLKKETITLFGRAIAVNDKTKFVESGGEKNTFENLKVGQRVEVTCKVSRRGEWEARKINVHNVKSSDKIKGTINRTSIDGNAPDTIIISRDPSKAKVNEDIQMPGIIILLIRGTDVEKEQSSVDWMEKNLFGKLSRVNALELSDGIPLNEKVFLTGEYRQNFRNEREFDLSDNFDFDSDRTEQDARVKMYGFWNKNVRSLAVLRLRKSFFITNNRNLPTKPYKGNLIQLYLLLPDIAGKKLALQVGRQDFDEPREWLFDEYLDAIRLYYYGYESAVFEAALIYGGESLKDKFKTWTDIYGSVRWYFDKKSFASVYFLSRSDSDDLGRNREPIWWGVRYYGNNDKTLKRWLDLAIIRGEDKHEPLSGWALDIGATAWASNVSFLPSLTLSYAFGSGDRDGDLTNQSFRQTGYDDNVDRFGGVTSLKYYGALLSPELSNIKIFTLGFGVRPSKKSSVDIVYHKYQQHFADNDIKGNSLVAEPSGASTDIGWGVDLVVGFPKLLEHIRSRLVIGLFKPGDAFQPLFTETALTSKVDIKIGF